jgi:hypothetical protein
MTKKPLTQGDLDGTCGVYSIINALDLLFPTMKDEKRIGLFRSICTSIEQRWPAVLWGGTTDKDLRSMFDQGRTYLARTHPFWWEQPFRRRLFTHFEEFEKELRWRIAGDDAFAVIGLSSPWEHWTTVHRITEKQIIVTDSCHLHEFRLADCGLTGDGTKYQFDYKNTFTLARTKGKPK